MLTSYELNKYAQQAAENYLRNNTSLDDFIYKIASEHDLNYEQIARIAEEANTQVYLDLFNKAKPDDRYVEFPTASVTKIASKLRDSIDAKSKISSFKKFSDYFLPPGKEYIPAPQQAKEEIEKLATIKEDELPTKTKYADKFGELHEKFMNTQYQNSQFELKLFIEKQADYISKIARQEILSGESVFEEFEAVFKEALEKHGVAAQYLLDNIPKTSSVMDANLGKAAAKRKTAKFNGILNKDHWYYKELEKLSELLDDYQDTKKDLTKAREKVAKWKTWVGLGLGAAIGIPAYMGVKSAIKTREEMKRSPLTIQGYPINKVR